MKKTVIYIEISLMKLYMACHKIQYISHQIKLANKVICPAVMLKAACFQYGRSRPTAHAVDG